MGNNPSPPESSVRQIARPVLLVKFTGGGVSPESVPLSMLSRGVECDQPADRRRAGDAEEAGGVCPIPACSTWWR